MVITEARLQQLAYEGDPDADAVVERHAKEVSPASHRDLVRSIAHHLVLPPSERSVAISHYLNEKPELPGWHKPDLLAHSVKFFDCYGLDIGASLFCASLPQAYAGQRGSRVLTLTGRLVTSTVRRVNETAQMVVNVLSRDGLDPDGGKGYIDARRVRLMHAAVRHLILHDPEIEKTDDPNAGPNSWSPAQGSPLCQEDMVGTLLTFTTVPLAALERIGIVVEQDDAEAYMHTWSVVGHLLGVAPDVLPLTYQEALDLQTQVFTKLQGPSPDALELGGALNQALASSFRLPVLRGLPASIITYLCGKEIAEINGVRADWLIMALEPLHLLATLIGQAQRHSHLMREFSSLVSAAMFRDFLHANRPGRPGFTMPRSLSSRVSDMHARWTL